jgi:hypothetical protein
LLVKREKKIILAGLNSIDKLDKLEAREQKELEEETRQEAQLPVSTSEISAPTNTPQVYSLVDLSNPFENPDFVVSLANYNPLDPFLLDQGISFSTPQTF